MTLLDERSTGKIHVDGWTAGGGGAEPVVEVATGRTLGSLGLASPEDVLRAAQVAAEAQKQWAATAPEERAAVIRRAAGLWEQHRDELLDWIVRESGSVPAKASLELHIAANECYEAASLPTLPHGEVLTSNEDRWSFARRRPVGVVAVIAPFNFPLILSIRAVAPALALGNAVLLKPDPRTGVSGGVALARIFEDAGLPSGLLHVLPGGAEVGEALVTAPEVAVVAFTGSSSAGRRVAELAARGLKRVHLELGGNNALVVLPGADVGLAASAGAFGSFLHQGQICMSTGRHLVHRSLVDEYVGALTEKARALPVGDPSTGRTALGPIIDSKQIVHIQSVVDAAVEAGATIAAGGEHEGLFYQPTVLCDVAVGTPAWETEIFGPVAPVTTFSSIDEVVEMINASPYGLSLGILGDVGEAMKIADRVSCGKVHINEQTVSDEANAPFGGTGDSGNGSRIGGATANLDAFTELQWLTVRPEIAPYPF